MNKVTKLLSVFILAGAVGAGVAGVAGCKSNNNDGGKHTHNYTWEIDPSDNTKCREVCHAEGECDAKVKPSQVHVDEKNNETGATGADGKCDHCGTAVGSVTSVESVSLDHTSATLTAGGDTLTLTATVTPAGAAAVTWESSDKTVATVSGGVVTPLKEGDVVITARAGDKSATCTIHINAAVTAPIEMDAEKWEAALTFGDKIGLEQTYMVGSDGETSVAKFDGNKAYIFFREGSAQEEVYVEETTDYINLYAKTYHYWSKMQLPAGEGSVAEETRVLLDSFKDMFPFDKFEKGAKNGEYVTKAPYEVTLTLESGEPWTVGIKEAKINFSADGKIISMEHVEVGEDREEAYETTFDYNVSITLPEVLEGEQVTKAEWDAALAMTDTNYRMGLTAYGQLLFEYQQNGTDKKFYIGEYFVDNTEPEEMYFAKEGDKFYRYESVHGHWSKVELEGMTDEIYASEITGFGYIGVDLSQYAFEDFTYVPEDKAYVLQTETTTIAATFVNKKLVGAVMAEQHNGGEISINTIEVVYGDAEVTAPAIASGEQVTDAEWDAAFAMDFDNFTCEADLEASGFTGEFVYKQDGDKKYQLTPGSASGVYVAKEGDNYYSYGVQDGVWKKTAIEKSEYDSWGPAVMLGNLSKSDFTYDEATGTYKTTQSNTEIKFVDKKLYTVVMVMSDGSSSTTTKTYFSYGTAELTLPNEGDKFEGGGGGIIVVPPTDTEKDITEDEWNKLFTDVESSQALYINKQSGDKYAEYIIDLTKGIFMQVNEGGAEVYKGYVVEDGVLYELTYDQLANTVTKVQAEYASLDEVKATIFQGDLFALGSIGDIRGMYEQFGGEQGYYHFSDGHNNINFDCREGRIANIDYYANDNLGFIRFEYKSFQPEWYKQYSLYRVTREEWNAALAFANEDKFRVEASIYEENSQRAYLYQKDGDRYLIGKTVGEEYKEYYYSKEAAKYYRYAETERDDLNKFWVNFTKTEITESEYITETRLPSTVTFDYSDFVFVDESMPYVYQNKTDSSIRLSFGDQRLFQVETKEINLMASYEDEMIMPQVQLTQDEWSAAAQATSTAPNFLSLIGAKDKAENYQIYFDATSGIFYKMSESQYSLDELYVSEGGAVYKYTYKPEENAVTKVASDKTIEQLSAEHVQAALSPEVLNGDTVIGHFADFEYYGLGIYRYQLEDGTTVSVKIIDGIIREVSFMNSEAYVSYEFRNFGTTQVEENLPYWYINYVDEVENNK